MKRIYLLVLFSLFAILAFGAEVASLPELGKPREIHVESSNLFVVDRANIYIYSLEDFKLKKRFGKLGAGPQEFLIKPYPLKVSVQRDYIFVCSSGKVSFFGRDGSFIKEIKTNPPDFWYVPLGKKFVGRGETRDTRLEYRTINLYDSNLKREKEVCRIEHVKGKSNAVRVLTRNVQYYVYKDKIFIPVTEDLVIDVFDDMGKKLYSITEPGYKRVKVTKAHQKEVLNFYKNSPRHARRYERIKRNIQFPKYFPTIRRCKIADDKIYVETYKQLNEGSEFIVFGVKGKLLKKIILPVEQKNVYSSEPYTITNGKLYKLMENLDKEEWELHVIPIK